LPACREEAVKASAIQAVLERREVSRKLCCTGTRNRGAGGIANFLGCTQHARGCFKVTTIDLCAGKRFETFRHGIELTDVEQLAQSGGQELGGFVRLTVRAGNVAQ
jgi:hypothetical protein